MTKSNGIKSLKQAAKLLNRHSPDGESLAYINPKEARLLKSHGGSGIQTLSGVPSYNILTDAWDWVTDKAEPIVEWLGYGDEDGSGRLLKDLSSLGGGYLGYKEAKELSEWEKEQYAKQQQKELVNQIRFASETDSGAQLLAPQNVPKDIEEVSRFTEATGIPTMKTTAVAHGGRIGYDEGTHPLDAEALQIFGNTYNSLNAWQQSVVSNSKAQGGRIGAFNGGIQGLMPQQGMQQQGFMPQPGLDPRMGYAAQGGRIGYNRGRVVNPGGYAGEEWITQKNDYDLTDLRDPFVPGRIDKEGEGFYQDDLTGVRDPFVLSDEMKEIQKDYDIESMRDPFKPSEIQGQIIKDRERDKKIISLVQTLMQSQKYEIDEAIDIAKKMLQDVQNQGNAHGGRIGAAGGGIMPLLDMGGMEKDYRQDGGFVPIGRKEKADDVPARLSKNEFVFTADAVKAAGGGDIDEGAQRMYNVMKNLEAGGEISEQSQGQA